MAASVYNINCTLHYLKEIFEKQCFNSMCIILVKSDNTNHRISCCSELFLLWLIGIHNSDLNDVALAVFYRS